MEAHDRNSNKLDDRTSTHLNKLVSNVGFQDSSRFQNIDTKYLYSNAQATALSRIDFILYSKLMNGLIYTAQLKIVPKIPDHKACVIDLCLNNKKGKGYWKLNTTWLQDETYIKGIKSLIIDVTNEHKDLEDKGFVWDLIKINIKEFSIKFAIHMNKIKHYKKYKLEKDIENYELIISTLIEKDRINVAN